MTIKTVSKDKKQKAFAFYEWIIAFRYILPNKKQLFTSIISIISLIGIFVGVWALIVVMAVMNGFREELMDRILGMNGHLIIQNMSTEGFKDYKKFIEKIDDLKGVKYALPLVEGQALVQSDFGANSGALIHGVRAQDLLAMPAIAHNIKKGSIKNFDHEDEIAIGSAMAKNFGLRIGNVLRIITPDGDVTPFGVNPRVKTYKIGAIFEVGMYEYDSSIIFMPLKEAQAFFNLRNSVKTIEVFLKDPDNIAKIKGAISQFAPPTCILVDWRERNQAFFSALQVERNVMFIILSLIILVAALNIISGLVMLVKEKSQAIAILRTMGATSGAILRIFIITGMFIGFCGTALGLIFGVLTCHNIVEIQDFVSWLFNVNVFDPQLYFLTKLPAKFEWTQAFTVTFMTLFLSFIATILPAWRAARLDPVTALRKAL